MPRGPPPQRAPNGKPSSKNYTANAPEEHDPYGDLEATKAYEKEQSRSKAVRFGGYGLGLDIDKGDAYEIWSSDDECSTSIALEPPALAVGRRAARRELSMMGPTMQGGVAAIALATPAGLTADFRTLPADATELPRGLELVGGGEPHLEKQEDGTTALALPETGYLKVSVPCSPWVLEEDGRLHSYSILFAIRIGDAHDDHDAEDDRRREPLQPMRLFNGALPPQQGEKVEHVQIYKNGGVGALGTMGTSEASVRRGRWAWITITRKKGCVRPLL